MTPEQMQVIADEYYEAIEKPQPTEGQAQFCIAMIGLVGAGKTTVLRKICEQLPLARNSADEIRILLHSKGLPADDAATIGGLVAERLKCEGYNVAHDNDFANPVIRAQFEARNAKYGVTPVWLRVNSPEAYILNKLRNHKPTPLFKDANEAVATYYDRKALHLQEEKVLGRLPFVYTFDLSRNDLDVQVAAAIPLILTRLQKNDRTS